MTLLDRVRELIGRLAPRPVCSDCIVATLELDDRAAVEREVRALAGGEGFERRRDACALCARDLMVIRRRI